MYSLLSSSNGLITTSLGFKKIILSTNLPNTNKIDEALIRPGRCFSIVSTRKLTIDESKKVLEVIKYNGTFPILPKSQNEFALSELYRLAKYKEISTSYSRPSCGETSTPPPAKISKGAGF